MDHERRTARITARVTPTLRARFRAAARLAGEDPSDAVRRIAEAYVRSVPVPRDDERPGGPGAVKTSEETAGARAG